MSAEQLTRMRPYIQDIFALVPVFDGSNIPYNIFLQAAEAAYQWVDKNDSKYLTSLIRTKVTGEADSKITDVNCFVDLEFQIETVYSGLDPESVRTKIKQRELTRSNQNLYLWSSVFPPSTYVSAFYNPIETLVLIPVCDGVKVGYEKFSRAVARATSFVDRKYIELFISLVLGKVIDSYCWLCRFMKDTNLDFILNNLQEILKNKISFHYNCNQRSTLHFQFHDERSWKYNYDQNSYHENFNSFITAIYEIIPDFSLDDGREFFSMIMTICSISKKSTKVKLLNLIKLKVGAIINRNTLITCPFLKNFCKDILEVEFDESGYTVPYALAGKYVATITIDFVPAFDGSNMDIDKFLCFVNTAFFMTYETERKFLIQLIRTKLFGEADTTISDEITCIGELSYKLLFAFSKSTPHSIIDRLQIIPVIDTKEYKQRNFDPVDAIKLVREFDGLNMPLKRFEKLAKIALGFVGMERHNIMNWLICTKVQGNFRINVQEKDITFSKILQYLKKAMNKNTKSQLEKESILEKQTAESQISFIVIDRSSMISEEEYGDMEHVSEESSKIELNEIIEDELTAEASENWFSNSVIQTEADNNLIDELTAASIDFNELVPEKVKKVNLALLQKHIDTKISNCLRLKAELEEQLKVDIKKLEID